MGVQMIVCAGLWETADEKIGAKNGLDALPLVKIWLKLYINYAKFQKHGRANRRLVK